MKPNVSWCFQGEVYRPSPGRTGRPVSASLGRAGPAETPSPVTDASPRRVRQYHPELLNKAVQLVVEKGMSMSNVSQVMGIPMTTLWRKVKAKDPSAVGAGRGTGAAFRGRGRRADDNPPASALGTLNQFPPHSFVNS